MPRAKAEKTAACAASGGVPEDPWDGAIVLCGPTASGKSELAVALAERLSAEIVGADSQQIYRGLSVGSCQPGPGLRARVPHELVGTVSPPEAMTAGRYGVLAREAAARIRARGKRVLLAGGTGLYLRAALEGLFEGPAADPELRRRLEAEAAQLGRPALHARLAAIDPTTAARLAPQDLVRVVRALEVFELTQEPLSVHLSRHARRRPAVRWIALAPPKAELWARIALRTERMYEGGLLDEARWLQAAGLTDWAPARSLGYRDALALLKGEVGAEEARARTLRDTRRYAKRQLTWFRSNPDVRWLAWPPSVDEALACGL